MTTTTIPYIGRPGSLIARIRAAGGRYRIEDGLRSAIVPRSARSLWADLEAAGWCVEPAEDYLAPGDMAAIRQGYEWHARHQWRARCRRPELRTTSTSMVQGDAPVHLRDPQRREIHAELRRQAKCVLHAPPARRPTAISAGREALAEWRGGAIDPAVVDAWVDLVRELAQIGEHQPA